MSEIDFRLPGKRYRISADPAKKDEADKMGLRLIDIDNDNTLLEVDVSQIPSGMTIPDFIETIINTGIVYLDRSKKV